MPQNKALIGIDWGTHSSKWTWTMVKSDTDQTTEGQYKIVRSEVQRDDNGRILLSSDPPISGTVFASSIKGKIIQNPDTPFWNGPQRRIGLTLGSLASFSLWALLSEAYSDFSQINGEQPYELDVRFSIPNWVDTPEAAVGRACFEQAARVACRIFNDAREAWLENSQPRAVDWDRKVHECLARLEISDDVPIDDSADGFRGMLDRVFPVDEGFNFRFVAESSAAGLSGLRLSDAQDTGYLLKILVVDVGAGSTDIGYVIRSVPPRGDNVKEVLCQFPPANTCPIAGNDLSRRIVEIFRSQGTAIGTDEAERRKISGEVTRGQPHPSIAGWSGTIAQHVEAYVARLRDDRWLPEMPRLHVLVTGGSGVVPGLREDVVAGVTRGLKSRGVVHSVADATQSMNLILRGPKAREANRLAVALGAANEDLPKLSYYQKLSPPMPYSTVRISPSWT